MKACNKCASYVVGCVTCVIGHAFITCDGKTHVL
jgi:hypothetical protein